MNEDIKELNKLNVPLPDLRSLIIALMKEGNTTYPLGDLLYMVRDLIREK